MCYKNSTSFSKDNTLSDMNTLGLTILVRMGNCMCARESVEINGNKYYIRDHIGEG